MEFPKYTREQNLVCKLTEIQIILLNKLRKRGWLIRELSKEFDICSKSVRYWLLTNKQRKQKNIKDHLRWGKNRTASRELRNKRALEAIKRKKLIMQKRLDEWVREYRQLRKDRYYRKNKSVLEKIELLQRRIKLYRQKLKS